MVEDADRARREVADADDESATGDESAAGDEPAADAFALAGNEHRVAILRALLSAHADSEAPYPTPFAALRERAGTDVSAQFAYHLDELVGPFVAKTGDGYRLRYAGWKAAAALAAGTYTDQPAFGPTAVDGTCPHCDAAALHASYGDAWLTVACHGCERVLARYPFPPGATEGRGVDALLEAFDQRVRSHFSLATDGACPECAGTMTTRLEPVDADDSPTPGTDTRGRSHRLEAVADCERCGNHLSLPVGCVLLGEPAVTAWCHAHDVDVADRPFWRVPILVTDDAVERTRSDPVEATITIESVDSSVDVTVTESLDVQLIDANAD